MTKDLNKEDFKPIKNDPPSTLKGKIKFYGRMILLFLNRSQKFEIVPRGTDILSVCSKIIVLFFSNLNVGCFKKIIYFPIWICLIPFLALTILIANICRIFNWGSVLDPLGYTIKISK